MGKLRQDLTNETQEYQKIISSAEERDLFAKIPEGFNKLLQTAAGIQPLSRDAKNPEAMALFRSETMPAYLEVQKAIEAVVAFEKQQGARNAANASAASQSGKAWTLMLLVFSVLCCGGMGWYIVRSITRVLHRSVEDLSAASSQTADAARQVSVSSQSVAQGASRQAASIEETSASTEEITSMTRKNAENFRQAAGSMEEAAQRVDQANRTLEEMVASMNEINASSAKISKIIKVIDEIAFQTNILALKCGRRGGASR